MKSKILSVLALIMIISMSAIVGLLLTVEEGRMSFDQSIARAETNSGNCTVAMKIGLHDQLFFNTVVNEETYFGFGNATGVEPPGYIDNITVDWSDGTIDYLDYTSYVANHTYTANGSYQLSITLKNTTANQWSKDTTWVQVWDHQIQGNFTWAGHYDETITFRMLAFNFNSSCWAPDHTSHDTWNMTYLGAGVDSALDEAALQWHSNMYGYFDATIFHYYDNVVAGDRDGDGNTDQFNYTVYSNNGKVGICSWGIGGVTVARYANLYNGTGTDYWWNFTVTDYTLAQKPLHHFTSTFNSDLTRMTITQTLSLDGPAEVWRLIFDLFGAIHGDGVWGDQKFTSTEATYFEDIVDKDIMDAIWDDVIPDDSTNISDIDEKIWGYVSDSASAVNVGGTGYYNSTTNLTFTFKAVYSASTNTSKSKHMFHILIFNDNDAWNVSQEVRAPSGWEIGQYSTYIPSRRAAASVLPNGTYDDDNEILSWDSGYTTGGPWVSIQFLETEAAADDNVTPPTTTGADEDEDEAAAAAWNWTSIILIIAVVAIVALLIMRSRKKR